MTATQRLEIVDVQVHDRQQPPVWRDQRSYDAKTRVYVFPKGESVLENLVVGRWNRPVKAYRALLPEILKRANLEASTRAMWSQKAGCACGCSPGFVLEYRGRCDVYVDVQYVVDREEVSASA